VFGEWNINKAIRDSPRLLKGTYIFEKMVRGSEGRGYIFINDFDVKTAKVKRDKILDEFKVELPKRLGERDSTDLHWFD